MSSAVFNMFEKPFVTQAEVQTHCEKRCMCLTSVMLSHDFKHSKRMKHYESDFDFR